MYQFTATIPTKKAFLSDILPVIEKIGGKVVEEDNIVKMEEIIEDINQDKNIIHFSDNKEAFEYLESLM